MNDYLIIPPVKLGQTVYVLRVSPYIVNHVTEEVVERIVITYTAERATCKFSNHCFEAFAEEIGDWVFLDREEAEQALKERESNA